MKAPVWWWETDTYDNKVPLSPELLDYAGPRGIALVAVYGDKTQKGWGGDTFMPLYMKKKFDMRRVLPVYYSHRQPFAIVMRSLNLVCIDIDGKNGGFEGAPQFLGNAPPTLSETSKSGNGYHLFYALPDTWDEEKGFAMFGDSIGIATGVDIRVTGCVYHHDTQRWNLRDIAPCPQWVLEALTRREQYKSERLAIAASAATLEDTERLMLHEELIERLNQKIPAGKRNTTLFAVGADMRTADVPNWQKLVEDRAIAVGLDENETDRLLENIEKYGG